MTNQDKRTLSQNDALHTWFREVADDMVSKGLDLKTILTYHSRVDIPMTEGRVKEVIFRQISEAMTGKTSSTQLTKKELSEVVEVMSKLLAEMGVDVPFGVDK